MLISNESANRLYIARGPEIIIDQEADCRLRVVLSTLKRKTC